MQRIRKDDRVRVIAGKDKDAEGRVVRIDHKRQRVMVEGVNYVTKHQRLQTNARGQQEGGIIETEAMLAISNVMPICPSCDEPTRVGFTLTDPDDRRSKVRQCRRCDGTF